jgi:tRNA(Arg) A34 adenosine deaminase TadA
MALALKEAKAAAAIGEVPVGAVVAQGERVVSGPTTCASARKTPSPRRIACHREAAAYWADGGFRAARSM